MQHSYQDCRSYNTVMFHDNRTIIFHDKRNDPISDYQYSMGLSVIDALTDISLGEYMDRCSS